MKKELIITGSLILLFIVGSFLFIPKNYITGNAISTITFPADCSEANIKALWDSVFVESSSGANYYTNLNNSFCGYFKNISDDLYFFYFSNDTDARVLQLNGLHAKINSSYRWVVGNITNVTTFAGALFYLSLTPNATIERNLTSISNASSTSNYVFKITSNDWKYIASSFDGSYYYYAGNDTMFKGGYVNDEENLYLAQNKTLDGYSKTLYSPGNVIENCTPNWTRQESICYTNDTKVVFYIDSNNCNNLTGKPSSTTLTCDNNSNGVIGESMISSNSLNLSYFISGQAVNSSFNYSNTSSSRLVEIKNDGKTIISFIHSFPAPLVLSNISITLNSNSSAFGSIIINGLDEEKSVIFDKKNSSSSQVCVRDEYVASISEISDLCEDDNEYLVSCPGTSSGYACNISGNSFNVSGLEHSAVTEIIVPQTTCIQNWSCTEWSNCTNFVKTRSCNDTSRCNNLTGKPNITEKCVPGNVVTPTCIPQWSCTEWYPEKCSGDNQTRSCTDINKCNSNTGKPQETQNCSSSIKKYFLWATIILFSLLIGVVIYFLISKYFSRKEVQKVESINSDLPKSTDSPTADTQPSSQTALAPVQTDAAPAIPDVNKK